MKRVLFDTNVLLDMALSRKPFVESSLSAFQTVRARKGELLIAPHSLATFYYVVERTEGTASAFSVVKDLVATAKIAAFDHDAALRSLSLGFTDFEDAMIVATALHNETDLILTRNPDDFATSPVPYQTPAEFLKHLPA